MDLANALPAPSATGLYHCLRQLAAEAATLKMPGTALAIHEALRAASLESNDNGDDMFMN